MLEYTFHIPGNHEDPNGNPIGYTRATQGSKFNARYKRYTEWKDYVVASFYNGTTGPAKGRELERHPFGGAPRGRVAVNIRFGSEVHSDPDNIVKGLNDALFDNDKHIDVTTHHTCGNVEPGVDVVIRLEDDALAEPEEVRVPSLRKRASR